MNTIERANCRDIQNKFFDDAHVYPVGFTAYSYVGVTILESHPVKIKKTLLLPLFIATSVVSAAQFESVIDAMAVKSSDVATNNGWEDISKIKGVRWKWPYYESGAHDSTMAGRTRVGKDKNPNIGATEITISGSRSMISSIKISISNESINIKDFGKGKVTKVKTSCDEDSTSYSVEFYRFEKSGFKPLFIRYQSSWGAGGNGGVDFLIVYELDDSLSLDANTCKVLQ